MDSPEQTNSLDDETTVFCATHPNVATELRCGRCGKPICPKCLVYTPVGARCRDCAQVRRLPTYQIGAPYLLKGAAAALVAGGIVGVLWALLLPARLGFYGFLVLFLAAGIGYGVGEAVSLAANRKRGLPLEVIAGVGVVLAYVVRNLIEGVGAIPVNDVYGYIMVGVALIVAVSRLR